jgi:hypothetical protein
LSEATRVREAADFYLQVAATASAYEVQQMPSGEAAYLERSTALSSGSFTDQWKTDGKVSVDKTASIVLLAGQEVYWDHSANTATYQKVNDRDFYLGTATKDASQSDTKVEVDFNKRQKFDIDMARDCFLTTIVGTQGLNTMGMFPRGGARKLILSTANEAQKMELISVDGFSKDANPIVEAVFRVVNGGAASAPDFNIGIANGTHATDFDSVTEYCAIHIDGNSVNINAQSKDGTTTVASTDTTIDYTAGSTVATRVHVLFDCRLPEDIQIYVNGALVLGATVFRLDNAASTQFLIAHLEKTAAADVFEVDVERLRSWTSQQ